MTILDTIATSVCTNTNPVEATPSDIPCRLSRLG